MGSQSMANRRTVLAKTGVLSSIALAGCTGDDGDSTDDSRDSDDNDEVENGSQEVVSYPDEMEIIVPYATGGGYDAYSRLSTPYWTEYLPDDPEVMVRNVTGGGGVIGGSQIYNAEADGSTIGIWGITAILQQISRDVDYDLNEMSHIGILTQAPNCLNLMESAGVETWDEFVNDINDIQFATQGVGSVAHTGMLILAELTGAFDPEDLNFVHYDGTGEALSGLERGEADGIMAGTVTAGTAINDAVGSEIFVVFGSPDEIESYLDRENSLPQIYTSELDVNNIDQYSELTTQRRYFTGPPGVPDDVLQAQRDALTNIVNDDDFIAETDEAGRPILNPQGGEELEEILEHQFNTLGENPIRSTLESTFED